MELTIRNERAADHRAVEELTRDAFWNVYVPGCDEHYLVHRLRTSQDFVPQLDFVAELDGRIVGSILFSRSHVEDADGVRHETVTFGPVCVLPERQGEGIGEALIQVALEHAAAMGFGAVVIYGDPAYYGRFGFRSAKEFGIAAPDGRYPAAHQVLELLPGALEGVTGRAHESPEFAVDAAEAAAYDANFPPREKRETESQERFARLKEQYL